MEMKPGSLVRSKAGHDKGELLCVVGLEEKTVWICDGRQRPLNRPKKKNPKHLSLLPLTVDEEVMQNDRRLRKTLFKLKSETQNQGG